MVLPDVPCCCKPKRLNMGINMKYKVKADENLTTSGAKVVSKRQCLLTYSRKHCSILSRLSLPVVIGAGQQRSVGFTYFGMSSE